MIQAVATSGNGMITNSDIKGDVNCEHIGKNTLLIDENEVFNL